MRGGDVLRRAVAEAVGTAFLLASVVGSGIMAVRLADGNAAVALLANAIATGAALTALILALGPISGAHLNPVVTLMAAWQRGVEWSAVPALIGAQVLGAFVGVASAHLMFGESLFTVSQQARTGASQAFSEFIATFGLLGVIWGCGRQRPSATATAVGAYITAAYWFTASTAFANPAATMARAATSTFTGIRPADVPLFILAQIFGAIGATSLLQWLAHSPVVADRSRTSRPTNEDARPIAPEGPSITFDRSARG